MCDECCGEVALLSTQLLLCFAWKMAGMVQDYLHDTSLSQCEELESYPLYDPSRSRF